MTKSRFESLNHWASTSLGKNIEPDRVQQVSGDASFRRYYRLVEDDTTYILMDAPPEKENSHSFCAIAEAWKAANLNVPEIYHKDLAKGFLIISDLGDEVFLNGLNGNNADHYYHQAMVALIKLTHCYKYNNFFINETVII